MTSRGSLIGMLLCFLVAGLVLFAAIERRNVLTELQLEIPKLEKELKVIREDNIRLQYELERLESPVRLIELSRKPQYSHLKYPIEEEITSIQE